MYKYYLYITKYKTKNKHTKPVTFSSGPTSIGANAIIKCHPLWKKVLLSWTVLLSVNQRGILLILYPASLTSLTMTTMSHE